MADSYLTYIKTDTQELVKVRLLDNGDGTFSLATVATLASDLQIGAVELKNAADDTRAKVAVGTAVTEADNALATKDASLGLTTDVEATGNGTLTAIVKRLRTLLSGGLPAALTVGGSLKTAVVEAIVAGANRIGKVTIRDAADAADIDPLAEGTFTGRIGEVQVSPTANTVLARLKDLLTGIILAAGANRIGKVTIRNAADAADIDPASEATATAIKTAAEIIDDWDEVDRAKVNPIVGQAGVAGGTGLDGATVQRMSLATDVPLPAGANSIGQVTANAGTNLNTSALALEATLLSIKDTAGVKKITDALPAGANLLGKVGIDQTTPGTTNAVAPIAGQVGVQGASGIATALTQRVVLATDVGLPAGTSNIGDVDVASVPAPLSTTGGGVEATALRVTVASDSTGLLSVDDNAGSLTVDAPVGTPVFVRLSDGAAAQGTQAAPLFTRLSDGTDVVLVTAAGELNVLPSAQPGVDIGDVTVNNAAGASAVNIQDGGNSITVDGTVTADSNRGALTDRSGTITLGGTSQQLAAANATRKYLLIQNNSDTTLWANFNVAAVENQPSIRLLSGDTLVFESGFIPTEAVHIIGPTTGKTFTTKEA